MMCSFLVQRIIWFCSYIQHLKYNVYWWCASLHISPMSWYIGIAKRPRLKRNPVTHYEASVLRSIFQTIFLYLVSNWNTKICFCGSLNVFASKFMWESFLNLTHVFDNPFHDHDIMRSDSISRSRRVCGICLLTWRNFVEDVTCIDMCGFPIQLRIWFCSQVQHISIMCEAWASIFFPCHDTLSKNASFIE